MLNSVKMLLKKHTSRTFWGFTQVGQVIRLMRRDGASVQFLPAFDEILYKWPRLKCLKPHWQSQIGNKHTKIKIEYILVIDDWF